MSILQIKDSFLKRCFPKVKLAICFILICLAFASCADKAEPRNTGVKANKEILASIYRSIEEQKNPILADEDDVFWTPTGTLWHTNSQCSSLARSETILHGSVDEAMTAGKERECLRCAGASELPSLDDEIEDGDVFFTPNGTIWHLSDSCVYLANSETILHGSVEEATLLGKTRLCSRCSEQNTQTSIDDEIKEGDVFWTSGGTRWHTDNECYHIANSETVYHGTIEEAQNAGKSGLCSVCEKSQNNIE